MSKKLIVAALVVMLAFSATAMGTGSRVETLGGQGLYLIDDTNIFANPATVAYYQNCLLIHMGGIDGGDMYAFGGATAAIGDALTLGVVVARNPMYEEGDIARIRTHAIGINVDTDGDTVPDALGFTSVWDYDGDTVLDTPDQQVVHYQNPFEVLLAYKMGDMAFGISYYLANEKLIEEDDLAEITYTARSKLHALKLGASIKMDNMMPEVWLHYSPYTIFTEWESDPLDVVYEETLKGNKIVVGGRLFFNMNDNLAVVPAINYSRTTGSVTLDQDPDYAIVTGGDEEDYGQDYTINTLETGVSLQYTADKLFVIGSLGLLWSKAMVEYSIDDASEFEETMTTKDFAVPVAAMGIEYQATNILKLRAGLRTTTLWSTLTETDVAEDASGDLVDESAIETQQATHAAIGVGLHFGNLVIDGTLGNFFLVNESGNSGDGPNLFSAIDVKYKF